MLRTPLREPLWRPEHHPEAVAAMLAAAPPPAAAAARAPFVVVNSAAEALAAWNAGENPFFSREIACEMDFPVTAVLSTTGNAGDPKREKLCKKCRCAMRNHSIRGAVPTQFHEVNGLYVPNNTGVYEAPRPGADKDLFCCAKSAGPSQPWTMQALWRFV